MIGVVDKAPVTQVTELSALRYDHNARLVGHGCARHMQGRAQKLHTRKPRRKKSFAMRETAQQLGHSRAPGGGGDFSGFEGGFGADGHTNCKNRQLKRPKVQHIYSYLED